MSNPVSAEFEAMMRQQGPRVYTLAVRLCGNPADGQDLAQETFVKAFEHWERFRGEADPFTWLYRICVNAWKNRVRYETRRSFWKTFSLNGHTSGEDDAAAIDPAAPDAPLGEAIETSDRQAAVQDALSRLDDKDRAIVVLRDIEDRSYEEISEVLDLPLGTVKSRLARSRERLRKLLDAPLKAWS